jgi:hypothetical protein
MNEHLAESLQSQLDHETNTLRRQKILKRLWKLARDNHQPTRAPRNHSTSRLSARETSLR